MASRFASQVQTALRTAGVFPGERILIAVSGGADSLALLTALSEGNAGEGLIAAHIDHQLRENSDQESEFVLAQARSVGARFRSFRLDTHALEKKRKKGLEESARFGRYQALLQLAKEEDVSYIVTGHTADDQAETVLFRLLRTGNLALLGAIPFQRELAQGRTLLRPMLYIGRAAVRDYLAKRGKTFLEDPSNRSMRFTRNRIRHEIFPVLLNENPNLVKTLCSLAKEAKEWKTIIDEKTRENFERIVSQSESGILNFSLVGLSGEGSVMQREVLRYALEKKQCFPTRNQLKSILRLLQSENRTKISLGKGFWACRDGGILRVFWGNSPENL